LSESKDQQAGASRREYPLRPLVGVGGVVVRNGKILLVRRRFDPNKGKWSFPGGLVELGESVRDAVKREVEEETGLSTRIERLIDVVDEVTRDSKGRIKYHFVLADFLMKQVSGRFRTNQEISEFVWVSLLKAKTYDTTNTVRMILNRLTSRKSSYLEEV